MNINYSNGMGKLSRQNWRRWVAQHMGMNPVQDTDAWATFNASVHQAYTSGTSPLGGAAPPTDREPTVAELFMHARRKLHVRLPRWRNRLRELLTRSVDTALHDPISNDLRAKTIADEVTRSVTKWLNARVDMSGRALVDLKYQVANVQQALDDLGKLLVDNTRAKSN